jgi:hypothetical protein
VTLASLRAKTACQDSDITEPARVPDVRGVVTYDLGQKEEEGGTVTGESALRLRAKSESKSESTDF